MNVASASTSTALQLTGSSRFERTLPALAALAYPGLIWCAVAIAPIFLAISIAVPLLGLLIAHKVDHRRYPRSRWIAFAVVGVPALYSLLGGWLDLQEIVPFKGVHVWLAIWLTSAGAAFRERPLLLATDGPPSAGARGLQVAHGICAALVTCFAVAHLANHFSGLWGGEYHTAIMERLRLVYRQPIVESMLVGGIAFQVLSGLKLLTRRIPRAIDRFDSLQLAAGIYLALFLLSHVSAVFRARYLRHTDTNWAWASEGLLTDPWTARLAPYYFLAVVALGIHGAAGLRKVLLSHGRSAHCAEKAFYVVASGAAVLSTSIMVGLIRG